jgi:LmbE family N-acetylglucosaminyl deacetylase
LNRDRSLDTLASMQTPSVTRRSFFKGTASLATPVILAAAVPPLAAADARSRARLKVVCVGGHPDDPESGCAGTLARYSELGHVVSVVYLTRGERGISGKSLDEAARIRSAEGEQACKTMGAKPIFFGQIDGATEMSRAQVDAMTKLLAGETPDVVFAHWPIDTHMDHQVASFLAIHACMALKQRPQLYFFEVNSGSQTQGFLPNTYVDISSVVEKKKSALFAHSSQDGQGIWRQHHEVIAHWRGREAGVQAAEAFVHLNRESQSSRLPGT